MKSFCLILLVLLLGVVLSNCGPDNPILQQQQQPDTLPPITTEGLQTFGYKVNDKVERFTHQTPSHIKISRITGTDYLSIQLKNSRASVGFRHDSIASTGPFILDGMKNNGIINLHGGIFSENQSLIIYGNLVEGGGEILRWHIDLDKPEYIISGTFWFTTVNDDDPTDTTFITDGRFDLYKR